MLAAEKQEGANKKGSKKTDKKRISALTKLTVAFCQIVAKGHS